MHLAHIFPFPPSFQRFHHWQLSGQQQERQVQAQRLSRPVGRSAANGSSNSRTAHYTCSLTAERNYDGCACCRLSASKQASERVLLTRLIPLAGYGATDVERAVFDISNTEWLAAGTRAARRRAALQAAPTWETSTDDEGIVHRSRDASVINAPPPPPPPSSYQRELPDKTSPHVPTPTQARLLVGAITVATGGG